MGQDPSLHYFGRNKASLCETDSPDTGEVALAPERERCPEGAEGENFAIARNISGSRTVLSPTACGRSPSGPDPSVAGATSPHTVGSHPRRGGQGETVGADSISARKACHCRRRPRATNGRPYTCNKARMQFFDSLNRRTPRGIHHTSICGATGKKKGSARRRLRKVNVQMQAEMG